MTLLFWEQLNGARWQPLWDVILTTHGAESDIPPAQGTSKREHLFLLESELVVANVALENSATPDRIFEITAT